MPAAGFELSDRELLSVFSRNLRLLTNGITSISALCQSLDINRVQFNRYLSGEATPRPLILRRICRHFGVDARILTDPLKSLPSATRQSADAYRLRSTLDAMDPVDASVLPDGLYAEWKYSLHVPGEIKFHVLQVRTEDGLRKTRVKSVNHVDPHIEGVLRSRRLTQSRGFAFRQGAGFAIIDRSDDSKFLTVTSFKAGYGVSDSTFTGIKHTGGSFVPHLTHCVTACVIERLPSEPRALLQSIRHPREQPFRRAPERIRRILDETCRTGFVSAPASAPGR